MNHSAPRSRREVSREASPHGQELTCAQRRAPPVYCVKHASAVRHSGRGSVSTGCDSYIKERRAIEQASTADRIARRLVDSFPDLIFVVDTESRLQFRQRHIPDVSLRPTESWHDLRPSAPT